MLRNINRENHTIPRPNMQVICDWLLQFQDSVTYIERVRFLDKMNRAADRPGELSGPTWLTRQNYNSITVAVPAAFSYPVASAVQAQELALVLAQELALPQAQV